MIEVGIVGATGYTGAELLRLLVNHEHVNVKMITSRAEAGVAIADIYPNLRGHCDLHFVAPEIANLIECDLVFFCNATRRGA